ncbi:predicted protein [Naegleria gruberi]|uniref:Predicted protein n=1 Tax=Naegleria gruberi TaxID=5762 RepID=D2VV53_NAEGR|nr:uncharacterized protein NAEGRDRAFT_72895 [Naegleria gruberi]EFC39248.1 predicted protein [Naegleria gruberi]|eukprot:XP_002671992.1 predicted protein [Naegleria gruberi strain NEG-M]
MSTQSFVIILSVLAVIVYVVRKMMVKRKLKFHLKSDLSKKSQLNIVITGGTRGIGFALIKELLINYPNHKIVYTGTSENSITKSKEQFVKEIPNFDSNWYNTRLFACVCDISNYNDIHQVLIPFIKNNLNQVDLWINNAGVGDCRKKLKDMSQSEIDGILNVNTHGTVYATQAAIQLLDSQKEGGHVYLMEGLGSDGRTSPELSIYGMSKASYRQFVSSLVGETADSKVGVHRVSPGMVITSMLCTDTMNSKVKNIFNILAEDRDVVAKYLIGKVVKTQGTDSFYAFLTPLSVIFRFLTFFMRRNKFFDKDGKLKEKYANQCDSVFAVTCAQDKIITGSVDSSIKVWRLDNFELALTLEGHRLGIISIVSDQTGKYVATSSMDSVIRVWDIEKGKSTIIIEAPPLESWTLAFSADAQHLATGTRSGNVNIFNVQTGEKEQSLDTQKKTFIMSVAYSNCGKYLACGGQDGSVCVFDISTSKLMHHLEGHSMSVRSIVFTNDSQRLISASDDKHINVYDINSGSLVKSLSGHHSFVLTLAASPTGQIFASGSADRQVKIWETSTLECIHSFEEHKDQVWGLSFNTSGDSLISVSDDMSIVQYVCPLDSSK